MMIEKKMPSCKYLGKSFFGNQMRLLSLNSFHDIILYAPLWIPTPESQRGDENKWSQGAEQLSFVDREWCEVWPPRDGGVLFS